jgi:adenylosuccinate lyase
MEAWKGGAIFRDLVEKDPFVMRHLPADALETCFDPHAYTKEVSGIFARVFRGGKASSARSKRPSQ